MLSHLHNFFTRISHYSKRTCLLAQTSLINETRLLTQSYCNYYHITLTTILTDKIRGGGLFIAHTPAWVRNYYQHFHPDSQLLLTLSLAVDFIFQICYLGLKS